VNPIFRTVAKYVLARLKEASTYRNFILLVGGSWAIAHPTQVEALLPVCVALAGFVGSFLPDVFGGPDVLSAAPSKQLPVGGIVDCAGRSDSATRVRDSIVPAPTKPFPADGHFNGNWNG